VTTKKKRKKKKKFAGCGVPVQPENNELSKDAVDLQEEPVEEPEQRK